MTAARDLRRYAQDYAADDFEPRMVQLRARSVAEAVGPLLHASSRVLEVGCGSAPLVTHFDAFAQWTIVEPTAQFVRAALQWRQREPRLIVVPGELEGAVANGDLAQYDVVICSSVLHEVRDPEGLLAAATRCVAPGGVLHVNVPNAHSAHNLVGVAMGAIDDVFALSDRAQRYQRTTTWSHERLAQALEDAGVQVELQGGYFLKAVTHGQLARGVSAGVFDEAVLEGLRVAGRSAVPRLAAEIFAHARAPGVPEPIYVR